MSAQRVVVPVAIAVVLAANLAHPAQEREVGAVDLTLVDGRSGEPVAGNVFLKDGTGKAVQPPGLPFWRDHFSCPGKVSLRLAAGDYAYEIERGPETRRASGQLRVAPGPAQQVTVRLEPLPDLRRQGWRSGEMHVHRPLGEIELLMEAADLHVAPVITWWNARNLWANEKPPDRLEVRFGSGRAYEVMGGEDEREGGALLYFGLPRPLPIQSAQREYPSSVAFLDQAARHSACWIDIEKPFWWDVPLWLATGKARSIGLANNHMCRSQMYESEAWGKPRDDARLPAPLGNGFWSQEIYYRVLESGLRLPPSAGSASGVLPNPVGYNRLYARVGRDPGSRAWWEAVRAGRTFVTNGPLLLARANGRLPGTVFRGRPGRRLVVNLSASVQGNDRIRRVEVIRNGKVVLTRKPRAEGKESDLGSHTFTGSGWFLIRALADNPKTFRFASTAPFYAEYDGSPRRISRAAAQFFAEWLEERAGRVRIQDAAQRAEVMQAFETARAFWRERRALANAD